MTVPACEIHNTVKSNDDWYLLWVLSTNIMANSVGAHQAVTKLARGHRRRPALGVSIIDSAPDVLVQIGSSAGLHEASEAPLDGARFDRVLQLIALGVYRHHFETRWQGVVSVHADFIGASDPGEKTKNDAARAQLFDIANRMFVGQPRLGDNPEVFWYQIVRETQTGVCAVRFGFYEGCTATGLLRVSG